MIVDCISKSKAVVPKRADLCMKTECRLLAVEALYLILHIAIFSHFSVARKMMKLTQYDFNPYTDLEA